jgi:hypothetical protein
MSSKEKVLIQNLRAQTAELSRLTDRDFVILSSLKRLSSKRVRKTGSGSPVPEDCMRLSPVDQF